MTRDRRAPAPGVGRRDGIPSDVAGALLAHLVEQGMGRTAALGLLAALSTDMRDGVAGSVATYDALVADASRLAGVRIAALAGEIGRLAAVATTVAGPGRTARSAPDGEAP